MVWWAFLLETQQRLATWCKPNIVSLSCLKLSNVLPPGPNQTLYHFPAWNSATSCHLVQTKHCIKTLEQNEARSVRAESKHKGCRSEDVPCTCTFMYLVFTRMAGEFPRRLRSLLLYLCYVFWELINSLVCWFKYCIPQNQSNSGLLICWRIGWGRGER